MGHVTASRWSGLRAGPGACFLLAMAAASCLAPPRSPAPAADEYAVWSAVLDSLTPGADQVRLVDSTFILSVKEIPDTLMLGIGRSAGLDSAAVVDLLRRNVSRVRMEARFSGRRPVVLVRPPPGELPAGMKEPHLIFISLPGFDPARRKAVVTTATACPAICGLGHVFELERDPGGAWRVVRMEDTWAS